MKWWHIVLDVLFALWALVALFVGLVLLAFSYAGPEATLGGAISMVLPIVSVLLLPPIAWFGFAIYRGIRSAPETRNTKAGLIRLAIVLLIIIAPLTYFFLS